MTDWQLRQVDGAPVLNDHQDLRSRCPRGGPVARGRCRRDRRAGAARCCRSPASNAMPAASTGRSRRSMPATTRWSPPRSRTATTRCGSSCTRSCWSCRDTSAWSDAVTGRSLVVETGVDPVTFRFSDRNRGISPCRSVSDRPHFPWSEAIHRHETIRDGTLRTRDLRGTCGIFRSGHRAARIGGQADPPISGRQAARPPAESRPVGGRWRRAATRRASSSAMPYHVDRLGRRLLPVPRRWEAALSITGGQGPTFDETADRSYSPLVAARAAGMSRRVCRTRQTSMWVSWST